MMELNLNRVDYIQTGVTNPRCMKVLPLVKKENTHKIAVADNSGVVQVFGIKKSEPQSVFKTLPSSAVTCLELGGPAGQPRDRLFVSSGSTVRGYARKGKQFLDFNTNITEAIRSIHVEGSDLLLCGNYIYHQYHDCADIGYYLCADKLNDVIALPTVNRALTPVLACSDRTLRILQESTVLYECQISGPPQTLCLFGDIGGESGEEVLYGTTDGQVGLVQLSSLASEHRWQLSNDKRSGGILSIANYDVTGDGVFDLILGRDDGLVEVYSYDDAEEPVLKFSQTCNESITSVQGGCVGNGGYPEVVCSTYTGWVFGFTTAPRHQSLSSTSVNSDGAKSSFVTSSTTSAKIAQLRKELDELTQRLHVERERYQSLTKSTDAISALPHFNVNDKFNLNRDDASYSLSLEVQTAIDNVLLQSDVPIDLMDVDKNSAVISFSSCDSEDGNFLLATYRCQANTTRLELKIRTIEGQYGMIQAYVTPHLKPKTCRVCQYHIKPLSMHQRINEVDRSRPFNKLKLTGSFSLAEMHSWVAFCLPEVPDRTPAGDVADFHFVSCFLDTHLLCTYKRGDAEFRSDNISTISILKDVLTKEATKKSIRLDVTCDMNDDSVPHVLKLIHPKLEYQLQLAKKVHLIEALKDLEVHENGSDCLSTECKGILSSADKLIAENKKQPCHLERLYGMVTDLYIDTYKFKGQNVKTKVQQLLAVLENYTYDGLLEFFLSS